MTTTQEKELAVHGGKPVRTAPWPARHLFGQEEKQVVNDLFDKAIATGNPIGYNGEEEEAYGKEFAQFMGGGFADGVNSGTSAVYVALRSLDLEAFTEVIVPPISDPGGVMPVPLMNCIPVPADASPGSYNAGPEQIQARMTPHTSAIIIAHIAGLPADIGPIMEIARGKRIPVVEDCAQAHGALYRGRPVGTFGDVAAFSTMSGKHHATGPQGGVVYTRNEETYWRARRASDRGKPFGIPTGGENVLASHNLNSNDLAAAIGRVQLRKLPSILAARRKAAAAIAEGCKGLRSVRLNTGLPETAGAYWFLLFHVDVARLSVDKETFAKAVAAEGIPVGWGYFHSPTQHAWCKEHRVFGTSGYPWASPLYKGDPNAVYDVPNARAADAAHMTCAFHERVGEQEVADLLAAFRKVEGVYAR